jgi:hypothetical protein
MNDMERLEAINTAIWLRDNAEKLPDEAILERVKELSGYDIFSNRNLSFIIGNKISHVKIGKVTQKKKKSGGLLAPESLEDIRDLLFSRTRNSINYEAAQRAVSAGTSQNMIQRLSGVSQSSISRRLRNEQ